MYHTDGSAANAASSRTAGTLVHFQGRQTTRASVATGKHYANYHAETEALTQAASMIQASAKDCRQVAFLSDALSVL